MMASVVVGREAREVDITSTRPGTPGGKFLRQFWLAVQPSEDPAPGRVPTLRQDGLIRGWNGGTVPWKWLRGYENTSDGVHVGFVHQPDGLPARMSELPSSSAEETGWGMLRHGTRSGGSVRHRL